MITLLLLLTLTPFCADSGFNLSSGSPAVDAGILTEFHCTAPGLGTNCIEWYGNAPDIGACEFNSDTPLPPPPPSTNTAPVVDAGSDIQTVINNPIQLLGSVSDDGLPFGALVWDWRVINGTNAAVFFNDTNALDPIVMFFKRGTYTLRLEASDGELISSDDVNVRVRRR